MQANCINVMYVHSPTESMTCTLHVAILFQRSHHITFLGGGGRGGGQNKYKYEYEVWGGGQEFDSRLVLRNLLTPSPE